MLHQRGRGREGETGINGEYLSNRVPSWQNGNISLHVALSLFQNVIICYLFVCVRVSFWCHEKTTSFQICWRNQKTTLLRLTSTCGNNPVIVANEAHFGGPQWAHILCRPKTVPHVLIGSYCRNGGFQSPYKPFHLCLVMWWRCFLTT